MGYRSLVQRACLEPGRQSWRRPDVNNGIHPFIRQFRQHSPTRLARDPAKSFSTTQFCLAYKPKSLSTRILDRNNDAGSLSDRKAADSLLKDNAQIPRLLTDPQGPVAKTVRSNLDLQAIWLKKEKFSGPLTAMIYRYTPRRYIDNWLNDNDFINAEITEGTLSFLFRTIGVLALQDPDARWKQYGVFTLECAAELGGVDAALILCNWSNKTGNYTPPAAALEVLQEVCSDGDIWQALIIRAQLLLRQANVGSRPAILKEALALARKAVELTEPCSSEVFADDGYGTDSPWRVLRDVAIKLGDQGSVLDAVTEGAMKYNDPDACELLAEAATITLYSSQWLELTTKAAMNGSDSASYALGKYWLEKTGWYPCSGNAPQSSGTTIGLDWLELAASKRSPQRAAVVYLTIGLVCHENGRTGLGKQYLEAGVEAIAKHPESVHTPEQATKAVEDLRTTIKDWDSDMRRGIGVSWQFFQNTKAAQYLMAPQMPPMD